MATEVDGHGSCQNAEMILVLPYDSTYKLPMESDGKHPVQKSINILRHDDRLPLTVGRRYVTSCVDRQEISEAHE